VPTNSDKPYMLWWQKAEAPNQFGTGVKDGFGITSQIAQAAAAVALIRYLRK
jgi:hypothetical protein